MNVLGIHSSRELASNLRYFCKDGIAKLDSAGETGPFCNERTEGNFPITRLRGRRR
jgi:hypothetical protein